MMEIQDLVSPIDRSGWMADVLTQHVDQNKVRKFDPSKDSEECVICLENF